MRLTAASTNLTARLGPQIEAAKRGMTGAWEELASALCAEGSGVPGVAFAIRGLAGQAERLLEALLDLARFLSQDVSPVLRATARAVGQSGRWTAWRSAVREVSGRECCMTRRFIAATLDGLADGLAASGVGVQNEAETALRLEELTAHHDPGVASAAVRVAKYFPLPK